MMRKTVSAALLACLLAFGADAKPRALETISYETGPCFGACPVYKVIVRSDGTGTFEGRRLTSALGSRSFHVSRGTLRTFAARLAALRPARRSMRYEGAACRRTATDLSSAEIVWKRPHAPQQSLYAYFGCDMEANRALFDRIKAVPGLLPIAKLIRDPAMAPPAGR